MKGFQGLPKIDWTWGIGLAMALSVLPAMGAGERPDGLQDSSDPISGVKGQQVTEDPSPVIGYILIDMRRPQFTFNPQFINPEVPRAIVPMGYALKIVMPDPTVDSCNRTQNNSCISACQRTGATLASCEVDIEWNEDGTTTRTLICTCALPGMTRANSPGIAGSWAVTTEIRVPVRDGE